ncbi:hypothetical protein FB446DRAFT_710049, partial [Lentinula raphanica]
MTPGQRIGEGYNLDDENDSTAWTKTTRGCGQGYESPERLKRNWFIEELQELAEPSSNNATQIWTRTATGMRTTRRRRRGRIDDADEDDSTWTNPRTSDPKIILRLGDGAPRVVVYLRGSLLVLLSLKRVTILTSAFFDSSLSTVMSLPQPVSSPFGSSLQGLPISQSTSTLSSAAVDIAMSASSETNVAVSANTSASPVLSTTINVATKTLSGTEVTDPMNASLETSLPSPVINVDANVSSGTNVTVDSIRSSFLQFMAANHLLDSANIAAGFSDSFVDGLVYCLLGHGIGIRQLTGTHDLERTIIMQQLDEAQVAQAAAET